MLVLSTTESIVRVLGKAHGLHFFYTNKGQFKHVQVHSIHIALAKLKQKLRKAFVSLKKKTDLKKLTGEPKCHLKKKKKSVDIHTLWSLNYTTVIQRHH